MILSNSSSFSFLSVKLDLSGFLVLSCLTGGPALAPNSIGVGLVKEGKFEEAVNNYLQALRFNPRYIKAYNNLGITLVEQGRLEEAIAYLSKALQIKPDDDFSRYNLETALRLKKSK